MSMDPNDDENMTEQERDEEAMDDAAQAGVGGAFGADPDAEATREQLVEDAEAVFGESTDGEVADKGAEI